MKLIDLKGQKFGSLKVIDYVGKRKWLCRCDCGEVVEKAGYQLLHNKTHNCGKRGKHPLKDLKGQKFGVINVQKFLVDDKWECVCDFGKTHIISGHLLRKGQTACSCMKRASNNGNSFGNSNSPLLTEWDYDKNDISPFDLSVCNSDVKVFWKCKEGHSWTATLHHRVGLGTGCPYCSGRYSIPGENDLGTLYPELAQEWDYKKNVDLTPSDVLPQSNISVYWKCKNGHTWKSPIYNRTSGHGCPYCNNSKRKSFPECAIFYYLNKIDSNVVQNTNLFGFELDVYIPDKKIAIEYDGCYWHQNKQRDIHKNQKCVEKGIKLIRFRESPLMKLEDSSIDVIIAGESDLAKNIQKLIFNIYNVQCDVDLERDRQEIESRILISAENRSLLHNRPDVADEFDVERNNGITPDTVFWRSNKTYWWTCNHGHSYKATVGSRIKMKCCPYCSGRRGRKIQNIDTGELFDTLKEAAESVDGNSSNVYHCCRKGKGTAYGYHWQFVYGNG